MVITHNLMAMNAGRQFNINTRNKAKSTEKLSSGYRISRSADDVAGLSVSENMRKRIRGLDQGTKNMLDGVSLCQVADGALSEVQSMLHRMTELAVESANGTNSEEDRQSLNHEINQIKMEINRIADTTGFNDRIYPLSGKPIYSEYTTIPGDVIHISSITTDVDYSNVKFDARPFSEKTPLNVISLFAQVQGTDSEADGRFYSLLYTGGDRTSDQVINGLSSKTSHPGVIYKAGNVSRDIEFNSPYFRFKSFTDDSENGQWTRVFSYTDPTNSKISFDITQTVKMNGGSNSYNITTALTSTGEIPVTESLIYMNFDTAYKGSGSGDVNEGYYLSDGVNAHQVMDESLYITLGHEETVEKAQDLGSAGSTIYNYYQNLYDGTYVAAGSDPDSFLIGSKNSADADSWMPFSTKISLSEGTSEGDFLILGDWWNNKMKLFNSCGGDGVGKNIYGRDHSFTYGSFGESIMSVSIVSPNEIVPQIEQRLPDVTVRDDYFGLNIQCSNKIDDSQTISVVDATLYGLGLEYVDISTQDSSRDALADISDALDIVSGYRGYFGAQQNRLEHSIEINRNTSENTQSAESKIRDTNMADEVLQYIKHQTLEQATTSMLSQANSSKDDILSLLQ